MISDITLKTAINAIIRETFPKCHLYGQGDVEGYKYPAIWHELRLSEMKDATLNTVQKTYMSVIQYIPEEHRSEADDLRFYKVFRDAMCCVDDRNRSRKMCFKVTDDDDESDRYIKIDSMSNGYVGESLDIFEINFTYSFYDFKAAVNPEPIIEDVDVEVEVKERSS
jgi:hypothetical protein